MLFNDTYEEDHDSINFFLKDIAEDPKKELESQFNAIRTCRLKRLIRSLANLGEIIEDEDDERLN